MAHDNTEESEPGFLLVLPEQGNSFHEKAAECHDIGGQGFDLFPSTVLSKKTAKAIANFFRFRIECH